jgi:phosphoglycerate kinase
VDEKKREKKDWVVYAGELLSKYPDKIILPVDLIISDGNSVKNIEVANEGVPEGWMALDIGPRTQENFSQFIKNSKTTLLAGPMGKFEDARFQEGSRAVFQAMQKSTGKTVIAGGDTVDTAMQCGGLDSYTHVSLAAGATLEFLAGKVLPALTALQ